MAGLSYEIFFLFTEKVLKIQEIYGIIKKSKPPFSLVELFLYQHSIFIFHLLYLFIRKVTKCWHWLNLKIVLKNNYASKIVVPTLQNQQRDWKTYDTSEILCEPQKICHWIFVDHWIRSCKAARLQLQRD